MTPATGRFLRDADYFLWLAKLWLHRMLRLPARCQRLRGFGLHDPCPLGAACVCYYGGRR